MTSLKPIIAIDGPAGSGKSTIAKFVAKKLGLFYVDTGAMYRALALKAKRLHVEPTDHVAIMELLENIHIELEYAPSTQQLNVSLDGEDVSEAIRHPSVTENVSDIAKIRKVREWMAALQRKLAGGKRAILEGRDITTVVFPDAYKKFYLDAKQSERVKRRFLELKEKNLKIDEFTVKKDIEQRDRLDTTRSYAPLKRSPGAIYIDTTKMSIEEVAGAVIAEIEKPL
jgi:cytidylate kinase